MSWSRVILLGEDIAHRQFLLGVCKDRGWRVADEVFSPHGKGAASGWVIKRFPAQLREARSVQGVGLVVALDGDNRGRNERLAALSQSCQACGETPMGVLDRVAILVPTWSIDTWALFFAKDIVIREDVPSKPKASSLFFRPRFSAPGVPTPPLQFKPAPLQKLVMGFQSDRSDPSLPSLDSSRQDLREAALR